MAARSSPGLPGFGPVGARWPPGGRPVVAGFAGFRPGAPGGRPVAARSSPGLPVFGPVAARWPPGGRPIVAGFAGFSARWPLLLKKVMKIFGKCHQPL